MVKWKIDQAILPANQKKDGPNKSKNKFTKEKIKNGYNLKQKVI